MTLGSIVFTVFVVAISASGATVRTAAPSGSAASPVAFPASVRPTALLPMAEQGFGIAKVPGMTLVLSGAIPLVSTKGTDLPSYASHVTGVSGLGQGWVLTTAVEHYGTLNHGLVLPVPLAFAQKHPGPCEVFVNVVTLDTPKQATVVMDSKGFWDAVGPQVTPIPTAAVHHGLAWRISSPANGGLMEDAFGWQSGSSVARLSVIGADLSLKEAQGIAQLVRPA